jgi:hypothetical protein
LYYLELLISKGVRGDISDSFGPGWKGYLY